MRAALAHAGLGVVCPVALALDVAGRGAIILVLGSARFFFTVAGPEFLDRAVEEHERVAREQVRDVLRERVVDARRAHVRVLHHLLDELAAVGEARAAEDRDAAEALRAAEARAARLEVLARDLGRAERERASLAKERAELLAQITS